MKNKKKKVQEKEIKMNKSIQHDSSVSSYKIQNFQGIISTFLKHIRQNVLLLQLFQNNFQNEANFFQMFSTEKFHNLLLKIMNLFNELVSSINNKPHSQIFVENSRILNYLLEEKQKNNLENLNFIPKVDF